MRLLLLILLLLASICTYAQFNSVADTIVCDSYTIPNFDGNNLSKNIKYATEPNGEGTIYNIGDEITSSTQLFIYDCDNEWEECFFITVIANPPQIFEHEDINACNYTVLPIIQGEYLTSAVSYYTESLGQGQQYFAGDILEVSDTLYLFDGINACYDEDTIYVEIPPEPLLKLHNDIINCEPFNLPAIEGQRLPSNTHYKDIESETIYSTGDIISTSSTLEIVADTSGCIIRDTVQIFIEEPLEFTFNDTTHCGPAILDLSSYLNIGHQLYINGNYQFTSTYTINSSKTVCITDSMYNSHCSNTYCFDATIHNLDTFHRSISDTIVICNSNEIHIRSIFDKYLVQYGYNIFSEEINIESGSILDITNIDDGYYTIILSMEDNPECFNEPTDSMKVIIQLKSDCIKSQKITIPNNCNTTRDLADILRNNKIGIGGTLFDSDFDTSYSFPFRIENSGNDTLVFYYLVNNLNSEIDTLTFCFPPVQPLDISPKLFWGDSLLCYQECFQFSFFEPADFIQHINSDWAVWQSELWIDSDPPELLNDFLFFNNNTRFCFDNQQNPNNVHIIQPNSDYYLVIPQDVVFINDTCTIDTAPDTIRFSTLFNTHRSYQDILCPTEELIIHGDTFNFDRPNGKVIIPSNNPEICDSVINVSLQFLEKTEHIFQRTFCDTSDYVVFNCQRYDITDQQDTIILEGASRNGCDSLIIIDLNYIRPTIEDSILLLCNSDSIIINNQIYKNGDILLDTILSTELCDSIYRNIEIMYPVTEVSIDTFSCVNQMININGKEYSTGSFRDTIKSNIGCDSILVYINIMAIEEDHLELQDTSICSGDIIELLLPDSLNDIYRNDMAVESHAISFSEGMHHIRFNNPWGCTEYDTMQVFIEQVEFRIDSNIICQGDTLIYNDKSFVSEGIHFDTLRSVKECDSIITELTLSFHPLEISIDTLFEICQGDTLTINLPTEYTYNIANENIIEDDILVISKSGSYTLHYSNEYNCIDSINIILSFASAPEIISEDLIDTVFHEELELDVSYMNDVDSYFWYPSEGLSCNDCPYPTLTSDQDQTYTITATSPQGCSSSSEIHVSFQTEHFYLPNVISPIAQQESNRTFRLITNSSVIYDLFVYDRWGNEVGAFQAIDSSDSSLGWTPPENLMQGVYVYQIILENGEQLVGTITVLR